MRAKGNMKARTINKLINKQKVKCSEIPHYVIKKRPLTNTKMKMRNQQFDKKMRNRNIGASSDWGAYSL